MGLVVARPATDPPPRVLFPDRLRCNEANRTGRHDHGVDEIVRCYCYDDGDDWRDPCGSRCAEGTNPDRKTAGRHRGRAEPRRGQCGGRCERGTTRSWWRSWPRAGDETWRAGTVDPVSEFRRIDGWPCRRRLRRGVPSGRCGTPKESGLWPAAPRAAEHVPSAGPVPQFKAWPRPTSRACVWLVSRTLRRHAPLRHS